MQQAVDKTDLGGNLPQRFAHLRETDDAVRLGDAMSDAGEETHLHHQPDLALVVLVDVGRRLMKLVEGHRRVLVHKHALPRHFHVGEIEHCIVLVEAARQRVVERRYRALLVRFARQHLEALAFIGRTNDTACFSSPATSGWMQVTKSSFAMMPDVASILAPRMVSPSESSSDHGGGQKRIGLLMGGLRAVGLRIDDDVGQEEIVIAGIAIIVAERPGSLGVIGLE